MEQGSTRIINFTIATIRYGQAMGVTWWMVKRLVFVYRALSGLFVACSRFHSGLFMARLWTPPAGRFPSLSPPGLKFRSNHLTRNGSSCFLAILVFVLYLHVVLWPGRLRLRVLGRGRVFGNPLFLLRKSRW